MDKGADVHAQQKRHCCLNKDISLHGHVNCTLIYILKINFYHHSCCGLCCGYMLRKSCDCVVHGMDKGADVHAQQK